MGTICSKLCNESLFTVTAPKTQIRNHRNSQIQRKVKQLIRIKSGAHFHKHNHLHQISLTRIAKPTRSRENIYNLYKFCKSPIGSGSFSTVKKAYLKRDESKVYAIKEILKTGDTYLFLKEIELLKIFDHPYIIRLYEVYENKTHLFLVQEYCQGGELGERIEEHKYFKEENTKKYLWQMLVAVYYIHQKKIAHRDLKPENFMFKEKGGHELKLIDFGLSQTFRNKGKKMKTLAGSLCYMSPEVLMGKYTEKCDVWSLGAMLYQLITGKLPFISDCHREIFALILDGDYDLTEFLSFGVSENCYDLLSKMLVVGEKNRITICEAINHPWFHETISHISKYGESLITKKHFDNLMQFSICSMFQRELIGMMVQAFRDEDEIEKIKAIFMAINTDFSGTIKKQQIIELFAKFGINYDEGLVEDIIDTLYLKEKGVITFLELEAGLLDKSFFTDDERLRRFFNYFDLDKNGFIDETEIIDCFRRFGRSMDESYVQLMIKEVDENSDGLISFEEFVDLMHSKKCGEEVEIPDFSLSVTPSNDKLKKESIQSISDFSEYLERDSGKENSAGTLS